ADLLVWQRIRSEAAFDERHSLIPTEHRLAWLQAYRAVVGLGGPLVHHDLHIVHAAADLTRNCPERPLHQRLKLTLRYPHSRAPLLRRSSCLPGLPSLPGLPARLQESHLDQVDQED